MKKSVFGLMMAAALMLSACGGKDAAPVKNEADQIRESVMNELTDEDKELVNEIAKELEADNTADLYGKVEGTPVTSGENYPDHHEPLPEIVNSDFRDGKVQIGKDIVLELFTMTFEDVDRVIRESEEHERYSWGDHYNVGESGEKATLQRDGKSFVFLDFRDYHVTTDDNTKLGGRILYEVTTMPGNDDVIFAKGFRINGEPANLENIESYFEDYKQGGDIRKGTWNREDVLNGEANYTLHLLSRYGFKSLYGDAYGPNTEFVILITYYIDVDLHTGECKSIAVHSNSSSAEENGYNLDDYYLLNDLMSAGQEGNSAKIGSGNQSDRTAAENSKSSDDKTSVWGNMNIKEYTDDKYGVHFYLPAELEVTAKGPLYNGDIVSRAYYVTGMGMYDEFLFQVEKCTDEVNDNSDAPEDELHGEIAHKDGYHYSINFINPETQYDFTLSDAMVKFINDYRQKILDSAWVD